MAFNREVIDRYVNDIITRLRKAEYNAFDLMVMYKNAINQDDYEKAQAIDLALSGTNFKVKDTHRHIKSINQNFWAHLSKEREEGYKGAYYETANIMNFNWSDDQMEILF